ncbi:MAG: peptidylprolyl isomerase [Algicola sp.]|nr:peptidylprolyl isomerase [Algicola sp.]
MSKVTANDNVTLHYTGKLENGQVFDSSLEREPFKVQLGEGQLIPGFERALVDMEVNEKKTVTIAKEDAYGEIRKDLFQKVPKSELPDTIEPQVGMGLVASRPDGTEQQLRIAEVGEDDIVIDANHPLAGQNLVFELEVLEIH